LFDQFRRDLVLSVLGPGGGRNLPLRDNTNTELLPLYATVVSSYPSTDRQPSAALVRAFFARYTDRKPRTLYRYNADEYSPSYGGKATPSPISRLKG
jgi:hypothetical protein